MHHQEGDSEIQGLFKQLLRHASSGGPTQEDWKLLVTQSERNLSPDDRQLFKDVVCLYTTKATVDEVNHKELLALDRPCACILAKHDGPDAKMLDPDQAGGLAAQLVLSHGAKVMITCNIWQQGGLVNATTGIVEDVIWKLDGCCSDLPLAVLVSCKTYTGPTLWRTEPRPSFPKGIPIVPVVPLKSTMDINGKPQSCMQVPLQLAWAVTIHKSQGLTLGRIKVGLGKKEFQSGLTFVALS